MFPLLLERFLAMTREGSVRVIRSKIVSLERLSVCTGIEMKMKTIG